MRGGMTKQEEIREGMANIIAKGRKDECITLDIAQRLINYLHSKGVVIKVDRELPHKIPAIPNNEWSAGYSCGEEFMQEIMVEAGYVAVKDLI